MLSAAAGPSGLVTRAAFDRLSDPLIVAAARHKKLRRHPARPARRDGDRFLRGRRRRVAATGCAPWSAPTCRSPSRSTRMPMSRRQMCALADIIVVLQDLSACRHARHRRARPAKSCTAPWQARSGRARSARRRPMLEEVNGGRTDIGPMIERHRSARAYEKRARRLRRQHQWRLRQRRHRRGRADRARHLPGRFRARTRPSPRRIADDIWEKRFEVLNDYIAVEAAAAIASRLSGAERPADHRRLCRQSRRRRLWRFDQPAAGAARRRRHRRLLRPDGRSARRRPTLHGAAVGEAVRIALGGKTDPRFGGGPLELDGTRRSC